MNTDPQDVRPAVSPAPGGDSAPAAESATQRATHTQPVSEFAQAPSIAHYFSESPSGPMELKEISVEINGESVMLATSAGVFSPGHLDGGTKVLLKEMTAPPTGNLLDLGCGWGPIALTMAKQNPRATVWAVDVNERSLELTRMNAQRLGLSNVRCVLPDQVPADITFAEIWSNPPIRVGKDVLHDLLLRWLPRLQPGASAYLVVQKNLGSDSLSKWMSEQFSHASAEAKMHANVLKIGSSKGFRVLEVIRDED